MLDCLFPYLASKNEGSLRLQRCRHSDDGRRKLCQAGSSTTCFVLLPQFTLNNSELSVVTPSWMMKLKFRKANVSEARDCLSDNKPDLWLRFPFFLFPHTDFLFKYEGFCLLFSTAY